MSDADRSGAEGPRADYPGADRAGSERTARFVTLTERDPRLTSHLLGTTDGLQTRPVLIPSLNTHLFRKKMDPLRLLNEWTFEYVPLSQLDRPSMLRVWLLALRPETWVLSVAPIAAVLGYLLNQRVPLSAVRVAEVLFGVMALHASINLFDDYHDHMRGWDRVESHGGARVLARAWLRARDVRLAAWSVFALASAVGAHVLYSRSGGVGVIVAIVAFLAGLEFAVARIGLKYRGCAEVAAWLMFGPMLTVGLAWALTGRAGFGAWALGGLSGSIALLASHLKNFESILADGKARLMTWPVRAGFEASKTFTVFCVGLVMASFAMISVFVDPASERLLPLVAIATGVGPIVARVYRIRSPVAGEIRGLYRSGLRAAWLVFWATIASDLIRLFGDQVVAAL